MRDGNLRRRGELGVFLSPIRAFTPVFDGLWGEREPTADAARVRLTPNSCMTRETNNDH